DTRVACFFVESLSDARGFVEAAREVTARKPVLVTKTGRTAAGARAALSHTAALAGDAAIWRAALEQAGAVVADSGLEMMDAARALDWQPVPRGPRDGARQRGPAARRPDPDLRVAAAHRPRRRAGIHARASAGRCARRGGVMCKPSTCWTSCTRPPCLQGAATARPARRPARAARG